MLRSLAILTLVLLSTAAAPVTRPAAISQPPGADDLHVLAYQALKQRPPDFSKASAALEQVYESTPPERRNRALILNRSLIDVSQRTLVMRGLKDLTEYLTKNRDPDEEATNLLGGALNLAAVQDVRLKRGDLWQTAFREWDRRNYVLDHSRKGWRRWGAKWVSEEEHARVQAEIQSLKQAVADQQERANRAYDRAASIAKQYENALNAKEKYRYLAQYLQYYGQSMSNQNPFDPNFGQPTQTGMDAMNAYQEAQRLGPEMQSAIQEFNGEMKRLNELQKRVIRPDWPTKFDPVDPNGPGADKPIDKGPAPTSRPAEPDVIPGFKPLPPR